MSAINLNDLGTHKEWLAICKKYKKPSTPPVKKLSDLTPEQLKGKEVVVYSKNKDKDERDFALIRGVGSSTPATEDYWVSGANEVLDAK